MPFCLPFLRQCSKRKLLFGLLGVIALFLSGRFAYFYFTEPAAVPQNVKVSNVSSQSLTISWTTEKPVWEYVVYTPEANRYKRWLLFQTARFPFVYKKFSIFNFQFSIIMDDHHTLATVHHITLKNLQPETAYYYRIGGGRRQYNKQITNDKLQMTNLPNIRTIKPVEQVRVPNPAYGKIVTKDGLAAFPAVVYLKISNVEEAGVLSTVTNKEGNWQIDLANFGSRLPETLLIKVEGGKLGHYQGEVYTKESQPVKTISLKG